MTAQIHFRCPCCHGSQYRTSPFDMTEKNPFGAKCIFCKSAMTTLDSFAPFIQKGYAPAEFRK
ncbi:cold-shock protein [Siccibacter turicensis]|uniref:Cold-shock protein n=1 Tax=Siccibacter turicensis TaxID=357233 RepID=A0A2P8VG08_9ENTR|nr:cold-shock protein [Siccibacter turicensis]MDY0970982.1 cold-shock protein [Siccibacter turicensis]PSN06479.1 cold-shock protein [Siccibacter turicensis]